MKLITFNADTLTNNKNSEYMTIQQLYDIAFENGALNYDLKLYGYSLEENMFNFKHKKPNQKPMVNIMI